MKKKQKLQPKENNVRSKINMNSITLKTKRTPLATQPTNNDEEKYSIVKEIILNDAEGNEVKIFMKKKLNRALRLVLSLNGHEIRPATFNGAMSGLSHFKMIEGLLKTKKK